MKRRRTARVLALAVLAALWALPLASTLLFSFAPSAEVLRADLVPDSYTLANYRDVLLGAVRGVSVPGAMLNSALILAVQVGGILLLDLPAGYAFARLRFPGRDALFALVLLTMMVPGLLELVSLYELMSRLGLVDTLPGIFLPGLARVFGVFLMRQFFREIPRELEDAARLDGATEFQVFTRIMLPLARPAITTLAVVTALYSWNNFLWPIVVSNTPGSMPVPVAMAYLRAGTNTTQNYTQILAACFVTSLPMILLFLFGQRWIVAGMMPSSGLK